MNTNLLHNILNVVGLLLGLWATVDLTSLGLEKATATMLAGWFLLGSNSLKLVLNTLRDGVTGLVKPQPPVQS